MYWEWIWLMMLPFMYFGLSATKKSNVGNMQKFLFGLLVFGFGPILYGFVYYFADVYQYISTKNSKGLQVWKVSIEHY